MSSISEHMKSTSEIIEDEFVEAGTFLDYFEGYAKCLPCKPGVYAITNDGKIEYDKSEFSNICKMDKLKNHVGNILYIGSSGNLNFRLSQLVNNENHVAGPRFQTIYKKEWKKMHIKYIVREDEDDANDYENYLISMYGSNNYENIDEYSQSYEYPPFNFQA